MNSNELKQTLAKQGAKFVYDTFLMSEDVWFLRQKFDNDHIDAYHNFKIQVSGVLDVAVKNIAIVGSAKTGYSLNPGKNFRAFSEESDLDLVIVSNDLYHDLWNSYFEYVNSLFGTATYSHIAKDVFRHFVSIKSEYVTGEQARYFTDWLNKVGTLKRELQMKFYMPADINYRVYQDWKYVERYYVSGLEALAKE